MGLAHAQVPVPTATGEMLLCESAAASRVVEKVRSTAQGILVESYVKVGDTVTKGQLLATRNSMRPSCNSISPATRWKRPRTWNRRKPGRSLVVAREETAEGVRRRKLEKSRLDWATAMEGMYRGNYEAQLEAESLQRINYEYWKNQYENRFFRAPVDGVVSEVVVEVGKPVNYATHLFTIRNEDTFSIPVTVPAELAAAAVSQKELPVRTSDGKSREPCPRAQRDRRSAQRGWKNPQTAREREGFSRCPEDQRHGHEVRRAAAPRSPRSMISWSKPRRSILNGEANPPDAPGMTAREAALELARRLKAAGYEALFAGGCVRDRLLEREPKDYDIATSRSRRR